MVDIRFVGWWWDEGNMHKWIGKKAVEKFNLKKGGRGH